MMRPLVTLVLICILPKAVAGQLSCYTCNPADCVKYTTETCASGYDSCLSASATFLGKSFTMKTCATKQLCETAQSAQSLLPGATIGNVKCCQGNLCNGAESFTLSFLLMFVPLLSSVLFY
ncbi:hypothetical protein AMELA_G00199490 [Ameiurus melas]|uniref:UPAR/Ly6 domain-containing protein n=1 Tax=Ameiurus melas TaxID=219545 RepID=A0A7J6A6U0_AMEME|nr:hypothetical protein AMELA_G00199490 [Ameiurus melas]